MNLSEAELTVLRNSINSNLSTVYNGDTIHNHLSNTNLSVIADFYNTIKSPQLDIWKPDLKVEDMAKSLDMATFITLTAVKQNGYFALTKGTYVDATNSNVRQSFITIFGSNTANALALAAIAKRPATIFESLFTVNNVSSRYDYVVSANDIQSTIQ